MAHLRTSMVDPNKLILFIMGLSLLNLLMLASNTYFINLVGALLLLLLAALIQAVKNTQNKTPFKITLMVLMSESFVYIGALLYNANLGNGLFTLLAAFALLGLWLQYVLTEQKYCGINIFTLELRYFLVALATLLTLNFLYFLVFLVIVYGQIFMHLKSLANDPL
jgi:hypothetical protein